MTVNFPAFLIKAFHASSRNTINKINQLTKYLGVMRAMKKIVLCEKTADEVWLGSTTLD